MARIPKTYTDDDGRVICSMDVEGMRWHARRARREKADTHPISPGEQLTRSEAWRYTWYAVLSGLLIVTTFAAFWVLFILFCTQVWFR